MTSSNSNRPVQHKWPNSLLSGTELSKDPGVSEVLIKGPLSICPGCTSLILIKEFGYMEMWVDIDAYPLRDYTANYIKEAVIKCPSCDKWLCLEKDCNPFSGLKVLDSGWDGRKITPQQLKTMNPLKGSFDI
jgi:hypothetical protein